MWNFKFSLEAKWRDFINFINLCLFEFKEGFMPCSLLNLFEINKNFIFAIENF